MGRSRQHPTCIPDEALAATGVVWLRFGVMSTSRRVSMVIAPKNHQFVRFAALVALLGGAVATTIALLKPANLREVARNSPIAALVAAAPPRRSAPGRLTGFPYRPFEHRSGPDDYQKSTASGRWRLLAVASEISAGTAANPSPRQLHVLGVSSLQTEHWASAVATLESAVERQTGEFDTTQAIEKSVDAALLNDLSVAYLAAATYTREPSQVIAAIECAEIAWSRSHSPESAWNRAVAFEAIHLTDKARAAWADYLKLDAGSSWSAEASMHISDLGRLEAGRLPRARADCASITADVRQAERDFFPRWARAVMQNDAPGVARALQMVRAVGEETNRCNGDDSIAAAAAVITALPPDQRILLAQAHSDFGESVTLYEAEDFRGAEKRLRGVEPIFAGLTDPFRWRVVLLSASCAYYQNEYASADALASRVIDEPAGEIGLPLLARAHWIRGSSRGARGLIYEAIADYQAAAKTFGSMHDAEGMLGMETMLASQYETAGESATAWTHRIAALELLSYGPPTSQTALLMLQIARVAIRDGQRTAAKTFLDEQLVQTRNRPELLDLRVRALLQRSEIELQSNDGEAARRDRREAFSLASTIRSEDVRFFTTTSADFVRARAAEGIVDDSAAIEAAADYARAHGHKIRLAELLVLTGKTYQRRGDMQAARRVVEEAFRQLESQGKGIRTAKGRDAFFESRSGIYSAAIGIALDQHDTDWAFRLSELSGSDEPRSLEAVERALPADTGIVKFCVLPDRLLIWLIRSKQTSFVEEPLPAATLGSTVRRFLTRLRAADDLPNDDEIHERLVAPWLAGTAGMDTVVFVTDGELANVPFCALHGQGRPLLETFQISYAPSVTAFLARRPALSETMATAVVTAPDSGSSGLSDLPRAAAEAVRVAKQYRDATLLLSREATRDRFLSSVSDATVVHFAGHAVANERDAALSALLLSDGRGGEAYVYAHEIASLSLLHTKLVVLAACSTAAVPRGRKSGLASLAYAFAAAGAGSVVGTLWPISDETGARVSVDLHDRIRRGIAPATALRQIQRMSIHRLPPRDWAAFVAVGSLDSL